MRKDLEGRVIRLEVTSYFLTTMMIVLLTKMLVP